MNLNALKSFMAIYQTESFVDAAKKLNFKQSSVSMQMKSLEDDLGVALFDRSVRPPAMTSAAIAIIKPVREILALADSIREIVKSPETLEGRLTLGAIPTATIGLLPDGIKAIQKRYPEIQVRVQSGLSEPLINHVLGGTLDAAIITEPSQLPDGLRSEVIFRERLALVSAIGSPLPQLHDLEQSHFIRFNRRFGVGQIIDRYLAKKSIQPAEFMELDSLEAILAMVERGIGTAIVPERSLDTYRQRVVIHPLNDVDATRNVSFIFRSQSTNVSLLEAVLAALRHSVG